MFCLIARVADIRTLILFTSLVFLSGAVLFAAPPVPVFKSDQEKITQSVPYRMVEWTFPASEQPAADPRTRPPAEASARFELEMAESPDFSDAITRYEGPDRASFISGLNEGEYAFRVRAIDSKGETSDWSKPLYLTIEYDSLAKALWLFGIGGIVSAATVALVVGGDRRTRRDAVSAE